jgi:hypothetical protein
LTMQRQVKMTLHDATLSKMKSHEGHRI